MAWYAHGGGNGRPLGAMRIAMKSPQTPDCRGGVFAVFAKIPPPIPSPAAHPIEASIPRGDLTHGHVGTGGLCSDVARRVVIKTGVSMCGMVRAYGGGGARMRIWGMGVCSDVACRVAIKNNRIAIKNNRIALPKSRVAIKITASRFRNCLALQTLLAFQASHRLCEFCMRLTPPSPLQQKRAMRPSRTTLLIQSLLPLRARSPAAGWPSDDARKRSGSSPCLCRGQARRQSRGT